MENREEESLRQRVERLERQVQMLQARLESNQGKEEQVRAPAPSESQKGHDVFADKPDAATSKQPLQSPRPGFSWDFSDIDGGSWLNRIGIVLVLLGVLFLFKYSIDQGWITPPVRSLFGVLVGGVLLVSGMLADRERTLSRQLLMGGGVAAFYITGFATFQLYDFLSPGLIWIFMVGVTVLSLLLAVQQDEAVLSILGTLGGLATPFMLYSGSGSLPGLILYSILVMSGAMAVYVFKGWGSLLGATAFGELLVLLTGLFVNIADKTYPSETDRWALQAGIIFSVIVLWTLPVLRELMIGEKANFRLRANRRGSSVVPLLTVLVPVSALFMSSLTWNLQAMTAGWVALGGALLFYVTFQSLRGRSMAAVKFAHLYSCLILLTVAFFLMLDGAWLLVAIAVEAWALQLIAKQLDQVRLVDVAHILFLGAAYITGINLVERVGSGTPVFNGPALSELFVIGVGALGIPLFMEAGGLKLAYRIAALAGMLGWLAHELSQLPDGQAYVSISWALLAVILLSIGIQLNYQKARLAGMATILLVVGKLLIYDLSELAAIWRIILFIGIGAVLLLLGYYLQPAWSRSSARKS